APREHSSLGMEAAGSSLEGDVRERAGCMAWEAGRLVRGAVVRGRAGRSKELKPLPQNKTKLVCTIGPASESQQVMEQMLLAGMNVARLNFSHGEFESHKRVIDTQIGRAH